MRERWADPEWRAKRSAETKAQHADPDYREALRAGYDAARDKQLASLAALKDEPEFQKRQREGVRRWHGQVEHVCPQCGEAFVGSRLARLCPSCRNASGAWARRIIPQLIVRDGASCHICNQEIDFSLPGREPLAASIDHLVPRAVGGSNALENLRLAHRQCNSEKGAR
jgi:5-methylcytosine-specific restriction endonuclease McrA